MRKGRAVKDFANVLLVVCIVATVAFVCLIGGGALLVWYVESRFGVEAVAEMVTWTGWITAFLAAAAVIFVGWFFANRSHAAGAQTATNVMSQSVDAYGAGFEYLVAGQKALTAAAGAEAYTAKAYAAQAKADSDIRVLNHKAELEAQRRELLNAPAEPEPVRRAPWDRQLPKPRTIGEDDGPGDDYADDAGGARFRLIG